MSFTEMYGPDLKNYHTPILLGAGAAAARREAAEQLHTLVSRSPSLRTKQQLRASQGAVTVWFFVAVLLFWTPFPRMPFWALCFSFLEMKVIRSIQINAHLCHLNFFVLWFWFLVFWLNVWASTFFPCDLSQASVLLETAYKVFD